MQEAGDTTSSFREFTPKPDQTMLRIVNKIDLAGDTVADSAQESDIPTFYISAKSGEGVDKLMEEFKSLTNASAAYEGEVIVSSQRHYDALLQARSALKSALEALDTGISSDLLSEDIRQVMYHIGTITGEITSEDILKSIFSKFCIGK
jgi:tRNA modification GTPase